MIICQLSIKINWTNNQQNQQNLPNNLLVHREIITLAKGWWRLSTTNDRSWYQELLSQVKNSPSEHMHWWSFTKYTMLVDNRRKNKRDNAPERRGYHTFSSLLGAWSWITTHCCTYAHHYQLFGKRWASQEDWSHHHAERDQLTASGTTFLKEWCYGKQWCKMSIALRIFCVI